MIPLKLADWAEQKLGFLNRFLVHTWVQSLGEDFPVVAGTAYKPPREGPVRQARLVLLGQKSLVDATVTVTHTLTQGSKIECTMYPLRHIAQVKTEFTFKKYDDTLYSVPSVVVTFTPSSGLEAFALPNQSEEVSEQDYTQLAHALSRLT